MGKLLTKALGNLLTEQVGKVLDIYSCLSDTSGISSLISQLITRIYIKVPVVNAANALFGIAYLRAAYTLSKARCRCNRPPRLISSYNTQFLPEYKPYSAVYGQNSLNPH